jgi:hypothetical protein
VLGVAVVVEVVTPQLMLCISQHHVVWSLDHLSGEPSMQSKDSVTVVVEVVSVLSEAVDVLVELFDDSFVTVVDLRVVL